MTSHHGPGPFSCLVAIGDSITMGAAATKQEYAWVSRLGRLLTEFQDVPVRVVNSGLSGNLISPRSRAYADPDSGRPSGLERYRRDLTAFHPDLVTVAFGLNDLRCGTPLEVFMADLDLMVGGIRQTTEATIVLAGVYYMTGYHDHGAGWAHGDLEAAHRWNGRLQQYAAAGRLVFADVCGAQGQAGWTMDKDGVHPNDLGHALIAHSVFQAIATHCPGLSRRALRDAENYVRWADSVESALRTYDGIGGEPQAEPT